MRQYDIYENDQRPCNREDASFACGETPSGLKVTCLREVGFLVPIRFGWVGAEHEVTRIDDRWPGTDHLYVKVGTRSGDTYILRHDMLKDVWEITLFKEAASFKGGSTGRESPDLRGSPSAASRAAATVGSLRRRS
jgi:hypothetical protein